ncbi:hypothetical protein ABQF26_36365, partial [Mycolicibacterium elephantis]
SAAACQGSRQSPGIVPASYATLVRRYYLDPLTRDQMIALGDSARRVSDALKLRETLPGPQMPEDLGLRRVLQGGS